ncbi:MAG: ATP-binding cassette domain-containing protein [Bacteroidia bacterium]|nr:ATP-binding cassette domain-containing protein [Bacteroidia bacterium]
MAKKDRWSEQERMPKARVTGANLKKAFRIWKYFLPYRWKYFLGLFFLLLTSATALLFPKLLGKLVESGTLRDLEAINNAAGLLFLLLVAQSVFSFFRVYLFVQVVENSLADLRTELYSHLVRLPMAFFSQQRVGELNSRISSDVSSLTETFTTSIAEFIRQIILIAGGVIFLAFISLKLTLIMLSVVPVVALLAIFFGRIIRRISRQTQDRLAESNTIVEETLQGIASVKAFTNELFEIRRYRESMFEVVNNAMKGAVARGLFASFIILCLFGAIVVVIWAAMQEVQAGLDIHKVFEFILYSVFIGASIGGIAELYASIQRAIGATERIFEILDEKAEGDDTSNERTESKIKGEVIFEHVAFAYPSRKEVPVLKDISMTAHLGATIAIVGPSGSGKSTLVQLLMRFYKPDGGRILIDGKNSLDYDLYTLRGNMAVVPQDVLLFGGTIRENISYGKPKASDEEIRQAAIKANALEFIESFPDKFKTVVGERGIKLSGGQRQRIAIARAVLRDPGILILDEATSSLDSESERLVQEALDKLMEGRTSFVIAHRLSTIRKADLILVLDKGVIRESGTHEELMKLENGLYRSLSSLQFDV